MLAGKNGVGSAAASGPIWLPAAGDAEAENISEAFCNQRWSAFTATTRDPTHNQPPLPRLRSTVDVSYAPPNIGRKK